MSRISALLWPVVVWAGLSSVVQQATFASQPGDGAKNPKLLVEKVVNAMGGKERFYSLKDVEYTYIYRDNQKQTQDISLERYVFDGELSWARYLHHEQVYPARPVTPLEQGYDGSHVWSTLDGQKLTSDEVLKQAAFLRKTNYYWFAMMFKLLDPGLRYSYEGQQNVNGADYDLVKVTFEKGVGDVNDTYVLFINRKTQLVDRFLFTVMDFGVKDPFLMLVEYEEVNGVKLPVRRKYTEADWDGKAKNDHWREEIMFGIRFNNGFETALFSQP